MVPEASVNLKNSHNLKVESYVLFDGNILGLEAWETASQVTLRITLRRWWGGVRLYRSLQQRVGSLNIKRIFVNYRKPISNEGIQCPPVYGKMQESGLTEIIPFICISKHTASILCFFHILSSSGLTVESGGTPVVARA